MVVQVGEQLHTPILARIAHADLLVLGGDLGHLVVGEAHIRGAAVLVEVLLVRALGDDNGAALQAPGNGRLRDGRVLARRQRLPPLVLEQWRRVPAVDRVRVGQRRVRDDLDADLGVPVDEGLLLQVRVRLELVRVRADVAGGQDGLDVAPGEVGDADVARQVLAHDVLERAPRVDEARLPVQLGARVRHKGHGPVDQVQVQVLDAEPVDGRLDGRLHLGRAVERVPELARHPNVLAGELGGGNAFARLILISCVSV